MPAHGRSKFLILFLVIAFAFIALLTGVFFIKEPSEKLAPVIEPGKTKLEGKLVAGFPELPVYPGSSLINSYKKQEADMVGFEANWEAEGTVSEIMSWYIDALSEEGWFIKEMPDTENLYEQQIITERNGLKYYLTVERDIDEDKTDINVEFPIQ